jgi:hypothetical protein
VSCTDGIDNDRNGLIDCRDPSCSTTRPCSAPVPVASPAGIALLIMALVVVSLFTLRRLSRGARPQ